MIDLSPVPNSVTRPTTFNADSDTFLGKLPALQAEMASLSGGSGNDAIATAADRVQTGIDALAASGSAASAAAAANVTKWISGTNYAEGSNVWSPIDFLTYRRKTNGAGTTDPSADTANWELLLWPLGAADSALIFSLLMS